MATQATETYLTHGHFTVVSRLRRLSTEQQDQVARQLEYHEGGPFWDSVELDKRLELFVGPDVMRPMSSRALAHWLSKNPSWLDGRIVFDIGTGCGVQALACARAGAKAVIASDVSQAACECSEENFAIHRASRVVTTRKSDLFEEYADDERADLIIFAQPFFGDDPIPEKPVSAGMLDPGVLVRRFLGSVSDHLRPGGKAIMMAWPFAGTLNDPRSYIGEFGFFCKELAQVNLVDGCQSGNVYILGLEW